jgi:hypothetical protein
MGVTHYIVRHYDLDPTPPHPTFSFKNLQKIERGVEGGGGPRPGSYILCVSFVFGFSTGRC